MKIAILGAGNMGGALARGLARSGRISPSDLCVSNPSTPKLEALKAEFPSLHVTTDNAQAAGAADVVILAVKPWKVQEVLREIRPVLDYRRQVVASVAGGQGTDFLSVCLVREEGEALPPVYSIIPNTAVSVGAGMTFLTSVRATAEQDAALVSLFAALGDALWVEEKQMAACTALSSCGIAYAMRYVHAAMQGGVELGLYPAQARRILLQTLQGAVELLRATEEHPEVEIDKVTTPGGLTIRGLNAMEEAGFTPAVIAGLRASLPNNK